MRELGFLVERQEDGQTDKGGRSKPSQSNNSRKNNDEDLYPTIKLVPVTRTTQLQAKNKKEKKKAEEREKTVSDFPKVALGTDKTTDSCSHLQDT